LEMGPWACSQMDLEMGPWACSQMDLEMGPWVHSRTHLTLVREVFVLESWTVALVKACRQHSLYLHQRQLTPIEALQVVDQPTNKSFNLIPKIVIEIYFSVFLACPRGVELGLKVRDSVCVYLIPRIFILCTFGIYK
jgi:hypothetical protein